MNLAVHCCKKHALATVLCKIQNLSRQQISDNSPRKNCCGAAERRYRVQQAFNAQAYACAGDKTRGCSPKISMRSRTSAWPLAVCCRPLCADAVGYGPSRTANSGQ